MFIVIGLLVSDAAALGRGRLHDVAVRDGPGVLTWGGLSHGGEAMKAIPRRCSLAILLAAAAVSAGCQASTMAYFLFPEAKHEAEMKKLASA